MAKRVLIATMGSRVLQRQGQSLARKGCVPLLSRSASLLNQSSSAGGITLLRGRRSLVSKAEAEAHDVEEIVQPIVEPDQASIRKQAHGNNDISGMVPPVATQEQAAPSFQQMKQRIDRKKNKEIPVNTDFLDGPAKRVKEMYFSRQAPVLKEEQTDAQEVLALFEKLVPSEAQTWKSCQFVDPAVDRNVTPILPAESKVNLKIHLGKLGLTKQERKTLAAICGSRVKNDHLVISSDLFTHQYQNELRLMHQVVEVLRVTKGIDGPFTRMFNDPSQGPASQSKKE